ncbi:hypothetical protein [Microbacterium sp. VKM Ac-2923]|uniref:hypothetical protein n=1 Tax=Microbacterium sp. VKM Ac-2923 TaxID=2929476 RepID=UPI001FB38D65|nr:hypothetical protein [Microbacterium sp. VKM Ac-2923]MCJ1708024.1 hypothetical protein [Microbacterium sp. VKM Ac-2923]
MSHLPDPPRRSSAPPDVASVPTAAPAAGGPGPTAVPGPAGGPGAAGVPVLDRRAVLHASAWAVPAIVLVSASPAAAVSGPALTFSSTSYAGVACGVITDAEVRLADGADAVAGAGVVLQLAGGYVFDGGFVTRSVVTDGDGRAACGTIHVPGGGATGSIAATATGATGGTATLASFDARILASPRGLSDAPAIPVGATPVALDLFLSAGVLHRAGAGVVATGIAAFGALAPSADDATAFLLPLRLDDGSASVFDTASNAVSAVAGIPSQATPIAGDLFLSGSTLHRGAGIVASDVDLCGQLIDHDADSTGRLYLPYRATDGSPRLLRLPDGDTRTAFEFGSPGGPPAGATPIADDLFFAAGAIHRVSWDGTTAFGAGAVASGIASWGALTPNPYYAGERLLPLTTTTGDAALFMVSGNTVRAARVVPSGATPLGADLFRVGTTIHQDGVGLVASDVRAVGAASPAMRGDTRVVVPLSAAVASC